MIYSILYVHEISPKPLAPSHFRVTPSRHPRVTASRHPLAPPSLHATSLLLLPYSTDCAIVTSDPFRAQFGCTANKTDCGTVKELTDAASPRATSLLASAGLVVLTVAGLVLGGL